MSSHSDGSVVDNFVKIDLHVGVEDKMVTAVNSMDEVKVTFGPLNLFMDAASLKVAIRQLREAYHEMSVLSNPVDPLPLLD